MGAATRIVCAVGVLSLLKVHAIAAVLGGATPRTGASWEPLHLTTRLDSQDDWRTAVGTALLPLRKERATRLNVVFVDVPKEEYLKFWVAPFLYDARTRSTDGISLTSADIVVVPAGAADTFLCSARAAAAPGRYRARYPRSRALDAPRSIKRLAKTWRQAIQRTKGRSRKEKILIPCSGLQIAKLLLLIAMPLGPPSILLRALTSLNICSGPTVCCTTGACDQRILKLRLCGSYTLM